MEICHAFTCAFNCKSDGFMRGDVRPWSAKVLALPSESDGFKKGGLGEAPSGSKCWFY